MPAVYLQYMHLLVLKPGKMRILMMDANEQMGKEQAGIMNIIQLGAQ